MNCSSEQEFSRSARALFTCPSFWLGAGLGFHCLGKQSVFFLPFSSVFKGLVRTAKGCTDWLQWDYSDVYSYPWAGAGFSATGLEGIRPQGCMCITLATGCANGLRSDTGVLDMKIATSNTATASGYYLCWQIPFGFGWNIPEAIQNALGGAAALFVVCRQRNIRAKNTNKPFQTLQLHNKWVQIILDIFPGMTTGHNSQPEILLDVAQSSSTRLPQSNCLLTTLWIANMLNPKFCCNCMCQR